MTAQKPLVSIIIPVYNCASYLPQLFESVLSQTYTNIEAICIDDGSQDESWNVLQKISAKHSCIKIFHKDNSGAADTRNYGIQKATGDYLCFVDADDFIEPHAIQTLLATAEREQVDVVLFDLDNYNEHSHSFTKNISVNTSYVPVRRTFCAKDIKNVYKHIIGFTVNKFYRADFIREYSLRFPKVAAHEDMPFTYTALSLAKGIYYLNEPLYHYRRSNLASASHTTEMNYTYMFEALELTQGALIKHGIWDIYRKSFLSYVLHMCTWQYGRKNKFAKIEFLETAKKVWFPRLHIVDLKVEDVFDVDDFKIVTRADALSAQDAAFARFYLACSRVGFLKKTVGLMRKARSKLVSYIRR